MRPRTPLLVAAFLLWSLFVWGGRIRNALGDDTLVGGERSSPILLAVSFVVPALLLGVGWLVRLRRTGWAGSIAPAGRALQLGTSALAGWTVAVWVVRAVDIALGGDHGIGFVMVHVVLAMSSIALAVGVVLALRRPDRRVPDSQHVVARRAS